MVLDIENDMLVREETVEAAPGQEKIPGQIEKQQEIHYTACHH